MTYDAVLAMLHDPAVAWPLWGSIVAGALIGAERELQSKPAGLRTHTLVCFSSALMTLAALRMAEWTVLLPGGTQIVSDMARMPHAILTGIGFLGAGVIFREGLTVQGLTTAASLWMTAALGITFGTGLLELGVLGTAIALSVLVLLRLVQRIVQRRAEITFEVTVDAGGAFGCAELVALLDAHGVRPRIPVIEYDGSAGTRRFRFLALAPRGRLDMEALARILEGNPALRSYAITPVEG